MMAATSQNIGWTRTGVPKTRKCRSYGVCPGSSKNMAPPPRGLVADMVEYTAGVTFTRDETRAGHACDPLVGADGRVRRRAASAAAGRAALRDPQGPRPGRHWQVLHGPRD